MSRNRLSFLPILYFRLFLAMAGLGVWGEAQAKLATAVWKVGFPGQDSLFREGLARDISQALAEDTALKVFDARRRGGELLDSLSTKHARVPTSLLQQALPPKIELALAVDCHPLENKIECRVEGRFITRGETQVVDTGFYIDGAREQRRLFAACLARGWRERWHGHKTEWPSATFLRLKRPAMPARLLRDLEILQDGSIEALFPGTVLETGDMASPVVGTREHVDYVFYPGGLYGYPLPHVLQLLRGGLGIWQVDDSTTLASRLIRGARFDSTHAIWRSLGRLAQLDSGNVLWRALGKSASLDTANPLHQVLGKVGSKEGRENMIKFMSRIAAMDTSNWLWRGLAQVAALDSTHILWRQLGGMVGSDSGFIWRQLGLVAFQDSSVLLTPACVIRGRPEVMRLKHQGSHTTVELVQGEIAVLPLLSSRSAVRLPNMHLGSTRGFSLDVKRMKDSQGEKLSRELAAWAAPKGGLSLAELLPGRLFSREGVLPTQRTDMQDFIRDALAEIDAHPHRLGPPAWDAAGSLSPQTPGKYEAGCYLCRPDHLGP